jgi:hypothetical protein
MSKSSRGVIRLRKFSRDVGLLTLPGNESQVWFDANGVVNTIGLRNLIRHYSVTFDSSDDTCFHVRRDDNVVMTFLPWEGYLEEEATVVLTLTYKLVHNGPFNERRRPKHRNNISLFL